MENVNESFNPFYRFKILLRKIRLMRRIGRRRKAARKALMHAAKLRHLSDKQWQRQRRRRLIRFVLRRAIHRMFQQKPVTVPQPEIRTKVLKKATTYTVWGRRKRIIRFLLRRFYRNLRYGEKTNHSPGHRFWKNIGAADRLSMVLNSFAASLIAYWFISFAGQLLNYLMAHTFGYDSAIRYYRVIYFISPRDYTPDAVQTLFSIEPFTALILSIISLIIYNSVRRFEGVLKQIFLWGYVWGMILFFGALAVGNILTKGFGHVINYLYLMDTAKLILTMTALGVLLLAGTFSRMLFLSLANCYLTEINHHNAPHFVRFQVVWPFVLSVMSIVLFKTPKIQPYEAFTLLTGFIFILPVWQSPLPNAEIHFEESGAIYLRQKMLMISIIIWIAYRLFTDPQLLGR